MVNNEIHKTMKIEHKFSVMLNDKTVISVSECKARGIKAENALGIVLQTPTVGMVVALEEWKDVKWGSTNLENDACGEADAMLEMSGLELTMNIVEHQQERGDEDTAAIKCWEYSKGGLQWYLPCFRELVALAAFEDEFNEICDILGADEAKLDASYRWSSSEDGQFDAWRMNFASGNFISDYKYYEFVVRAVCAFSSILDARRSFNAEQMEQAVVTDLSQATDEELVIELRKRNFSGRIIKSIEYTV